MNNSYTCIYKEKKRINLLIYATQIIVSKFIHIEIDNNSDTYISRY